MAGAAGAVVRRHLPGPSRPHFRKLVSYGSVPDWIGHDDGASAANMFLVKAAMEGPGRVAGGVAAMEGPGGAAGRVAAAVPLVDVKLNVVSIRVRAKNRNRSWNFRALNSPFISPGGRRGGGDIWLVSC